MKGQMLICFFLLKDQHQEKSLPFCHHTSHEHPMNIYLCILAMFTMSLKDVKHVNLPSLEVLNVRVCKCETRGESAVKLWFPDDIAIKLAIYPRSYILILIRVKNFLS